jgi:CRP-like cAMP-binding protein
VRLWDQLFSGAAQRRLDAGEALFSAGDIGNSCYRLEQGLLKVQVDSSAGEKRIVSLLGPGTVVGALSLIDGLPRLATVIALRESVLRFVQAETFRLYVSKRPETFETLAAVLSMRLRDAVATIAASTFLSVRESVAHALLELAKHAGKDAGDGRVVINFLVSQADLAAIAGVARENVSRVFSDLRKRKVVTVLKDGIRLDDIAALERELDHGLGSRHDRKSDVGRHANNGAWDSVCTVRAHK